MKLKRIFLYLALIAMLAVTLFLPIRWWIKAFLEWNLIWILATVIQWHRYTEIDGRIPTSPEEEIMHNELERK